MAGVSAGAGPRADGGTPLNARTIALLTVAALAVFALAYEAGGLFGRAADDAGGGVRLVPAVEATSTPDFTVRAVNVAFDTDRLDPRAGRAVIIRFENGDAGILHNIAIYRDERAADLVQRGQLFDGPRTREYQFEAFTAGSYLFQCDLHPAMRGTLVAQ